MTPPSPSSVQNNIVKSRACTTIRNTCMNETMIHNRTCTATPMCNKPLSFHTDNYCAWYKNYTRLFPLCFKPTHAIQNKPIKGDNRVQKGNLQQDTSQFTLGSWGLVPRRDGGMSHNLQHFMISKPPTPPPPPKEQSHTRVCVTQHNEKFTQDDWQWYVNSQIFHPKDDSSPTFRKRALHTACTMSR